MLMILQVFGTIAALTVAFRAIAKLHFRMRQIRDPADDTLVSRFYLIAGRFRLPCHASAAVTDPVHEILAKKQQEVTHRRQHEQLDRPESHDQGVQVSQPSDEGQPFDFHWQNEEKV